MFLLEIVTKNKLYALDATLALEVVQNCLTKDLQYGDISIIEVKDNVLKILISNEDILNKILSKIMEIKIGGNKIIYKNVKLDIDRVKIDKYNSVELGDNVEVIFEKEVLFKIGSNFKDNFSIYFMFDWLAKKHNKTNEEKKIFIDENLVNKIEVIEEIKNISVNVKGFEAPGFIGRVKLNLSGLGEEKNNIKKLLQYGFLNGVGFNSNKGYGKIKIKNL